jgi:hypothetical protein
VVLCLKLWSVRGGGTVRVTKCVIFPPEWLTVILGWKGNETARKRHGTCTYGPKTNANLIRSHLQGFGKNPGVFEKVDPGAENRVL